MIEKALSVIDRVNRWSAEYFVAYLLPVLMVVVVYEVVGRYLFNTPTEWAFETSYFLTGALTILGGAYLLLYNAHVRVDLFWGRFSKRGQAITDLATFVFFALVVAILLWWGTAALWNSLQPPLEHTETPWAPVLWPIRTAIVTGAFLLLLQGVAKFIRDFRTAITKEKK